MANSLNRLIVKSLHRFIVESLHRFIVESLTRGFWGGPYTVAAAALFAATLVCSAGNILENAQKEMSAWCVAPCAANPILADAETSSAISGGLDAVAAGGSVATLSFVVKSAKPVSAFMATCNGLTCDGKSIPASAVDILIVKRWYQDGNAWFTEARDPAGRILVPELLLHDDTLVTVDDKTFANAVRSGGRAIPVAEVTAADRDAPALRPFALRAGEARQLIIRIAVAPGTPPGIYRGNLAFSVDGGNKPITLRVLDYDLPPPTARFTETPYLFVSGQDWPGATKGAASFTRIDSRKFADEAYVVGKAEDPKLAAAKKYHVFRSPASQRQLQARRSIGAIALDATPPFAGIENPAPWRRNKGINAWLAGYGGVLVPSFAEAKSPWDDNHGDTRSRTLLYPAEGGAIPTLASVALEEACQDVRYLSLLNREARRLLNASDSRLVVEGRRALAWLADIDAGVSAPDTIRLDAIAWLERLHTLTAPSQKSDAP
jgi:hypothetical protein